MRKIKIYPKDKFHFYYDGACTKLKEPIEGEYCYNDEYRPRICNPFRFSIITYQLRNNQWIEQN
jgi:hypothetical protein